MSLVLFSILNTILSHFLGCVSVDSEITVFVREKTSPTLFFFSLYFVFLFFCLFLWCWVVLFSENAKHKVMLRH